MYLPVNHGSWHEEVVVESSSRNTLRKKALHTLVLILHGNLSSWSVEAFLHAVPDIVILSIRRWQWMVISVHHGVDRHVDVSLAWL
jgi:hypothetical protein